MRDYYEGDTPEAHRFRYALLAFDLVTVAFIVVTSFLPRGDLVEQLDVLFGAVIMVDFTVRLAISRRPWRDLLHPATWADVAAIVSFLAPLVGEGAGFLRVLRTVRLLHTYQLLARLRLDSPWFCRNEEVILAAVHLAVFIFVMTGIVYETQHAQNPSIANYADALYFTVTALTTTGFGDITLAGTSGRLISVVIMILGVTLFLNLARTVLQPSKVRFDCPNCGLMRHEPDAVHCKACGIVLNIPDEGR
ncbi:potassium channel family protein [Rhodoplanes roseus]|uniref:Ion transporter n=1 Tax=Rhodoplanes roseus TaxID=29409 RepID=A0A327L8N1_9BRAD|nr:potassium channel family protein [Rhodoplanes roseus]RAI44048.1 ion transporter [Rhodoplanes roseus]